jgi:purine-binding chemotaxis protein CheW
VPGPDSRILILDWQDEHVGLLVGRIHDMVETERERIGEAPSNLKQSLGGFLAGVVQVREHMVSLLDPEAVLAVEETA